jgi:multicomponent Na+:H+ antiporter subunit D
MDSVTDRSGSSPDRPRLAAATALIVIGLGIKMALFPLHVWLPDAHSHAPPAVAALLAAVQVKVAAYALIRILFDVFPPATPSTTSRCSAAHLVRCGRAWSSDRCGHPPDRPQADAGPQHRRPAGLHRVGIGLANPLALVGALLHVVNHAAMKACLFFVAGRVLEQAGTKKIPDYAGLGRPDAVDDGGFTVAAISMVGLPPTAGFFSKWYLVSGALDDGQWVVAVVIVASSVLTLIYFLRALELIWFAQPSSGSWHRSDRPPVRARGLLPSPVAHHSLHRCGHG